MLNPSTRLERTGESRQKYKFTPCVQTSQRSSETDASLFLSSGAVLSLTMGEDGESCYSGGLDGTVRCWKMPDLNVDPYDNYGQSFPTEYLAITK